MGSIDNVNRLELPEKEKQEVEVKPESESICRTAIRFGRMWGIMETLGKLPPMRTVEEKESMCSRYEGLVLAWAEEYAAEENEDFVNFFERKLDTVTFRDIQT